jgi:hypothetical protein
MAARVGEGAPAPGKVVQKHDAARIGRRGQHQVACIDGAVQEAFSSCSDGAIYVLRLGLTSRFRDFCFDLKRIHFPFYGDYFGSV